MTLNPILRNIYQGAREGAANGAMSGSSLIALTCVVSTYYACSEQINRMIGNAPQVPMFEGDCQLEQFRNSPTCTSSPVFESYTSLTIYVIGTTTLIGMIAGGVYGALRSTSPKSKTENANYLPV